MSEVVLHILELRSMAADFLMVRMYDKVHVLSANNGDRAASWTGSLRGLLPLQGGGNQGTSGTMAQTASPLPRPEQVRIGHRSKNMRMAQHMWTPLTRHCMRFAFPPFEDYSEMQAHLYS